MTEAVRGRLITTPGEVQGRLVSQPSPSVEATTLQPTPRDLLMQEINAALDVPDFNSPEALAEQDRMARITDDIIRGLADTFTLGAAGEIAAGANAVLGRGDFESNLAAEEARDAEISPESKATSAALSLAVPAGPAAQFIGRGGNLASRALRAAGVGAAGGSVAGAGFAPESERLRGAVTGGLTGAALGPAGVVAAPATAGVARAVRAGFNRLPGRASAREQARLATAQGKALEKVRELFDRDEITFEQARRKLQQLGPDATLADVGQQNVRSGLAAAANVPGQAKRRTSRVLETRVRQQNRRLRSAVQDGISDADFDATVTGTIQRRAEQAGPLYDAARASGVVDNENLDRLMRLKSVQASIARVRARNPNLLDVPDNDMLVLDAVYKDLSGQRQAAIRAGEKGSGSLAHDLGRRQSDLLNAIAEDVPVYRDAVRTFSDESSLIDAANLGRRFLREDAAVTDRTLRDMSDGEREMFLTGATREVIDIIESTPNSANAVRRIFGNDRKQRQLRSLFSSKREFDRFKLQMLTEQRFAETRNDIIPGSRTAPLTASILDQSKSPVREAAETVAEGAVTGDPGVIRRIVMSAARRIADAGQPDEKMKNEIARLLTTQGIPANDRILDQIFQRAGELTSRQ